MNNYCIHVCWTLHSLPLESRTLFHPHMNRPYPFGNRNAKSLMVVHLLLIIIVTVAMVTTLPTLALIG